MAIDYHNLKGAKKSRKQRVGRGLGSGRGTTANRGQKGQKARSGAGGHARIGMRKLILATPKLRGFKAITAKPAVVNLADLSAQFAKGGEVTPETLVEKGLIRTAKNGAKILGTGEITVAVAVSGCSVSKTASEAILKAGGTIKA